MKTPPQARHTPTPWTTAWEEGFSAHYIDGPTLDSHGFIMLQPQTGREDADAAFIVRAVNAHEELVETLKGITKAFKKLSEKYEPDNTDAEWLAHATEAIARTSSGGL